MAHDDDRRRVAAVFLGMIVSPADRLGHVSRDLIDRDVGHEAIVGRYQDEALFRERLRLVVHLGLVAALPAAAVDPHHDRQVLAAGRSVDIEHLPLVFGFGVGQALVNRRLTGDQRGGGEDDEESYEPAHGCLQGNRLPKYSRLRESKVVRTQSCIGNVSNTRAPSRTTVAAIRSPAFLAVTPCASTSVSRFRSVRPSNSTSMSPTRKPACLAAAWGPYWPTCLPRSAMPSPVMRAWARSFAGSSSSSKPPVAMRRNPHEELRQPRSPARRHPGGSVSVCCRVCPARFTSAGTAAPFAGVSCRT